MGDHTCPECSKGRLVQDFTNGDYYCSHCGIIFNEYSLQVAEEFLSYPEMQTHSPLPFMEEMGPSTEIAPGMRDGHGNHLSSHKLLEIHRLRKTERFTKFATTTGRNLNHMLGFISAITSRLEITRPAKEFSLHLYADLVHRRITVGRDSRALAAASIYAGCRYHSLPYSLEDIAKIVLDHVNPIAAKKRVGKAYRIIIKEMGYRISPPTPSDYLARYASELDLSPKTERKARELLNRVLKSGIPGGEPSSVAAALIYLASKLLGKKVTQKMITSKTGVTDTTIRTRYRELKSMFEVT